MKSIYGWQDEFLADFFKKIATQDAYTLAACPGAGKTTASLKAAARLIKARIVQGVVICAHSDEICDQWRSKGTALGLNLYCGWRTEHGPQRDYQGLAVTFQSLNTNAIAHRARCAQQPTLLIIDEAHHIGADLPWDAALNSAFEPAKKTLVLSGTPFRHDGRLPAFIEHTRDPKTGELMRQVDFPYSYRRAIEDGVCREIYFPHFDGEADWRSFSGERQTAKISDNLKGRLESERNRAILDANGDWIRTVFREADFKLGECREAGHARAGGLILATNKDEARNFQRTLSEVTGHRAILVVSGEPGADDRIKAFRRSDDRWVIAVKMINEGVDISRLRVLVYATICQTELHFLQAMGRIARAGDDEEKYLAYAFLPHRKEFLEYAANMRKERDAAVETIKKRLVDIERDPPVDPLPSQFLPIGSSAIPMGVLGANGNSSPEDIAHAEEYKRTNGLKYPAEVIAEILRPMRGVTAASAEKTTAATEAPVDLQLEAQRWKDRINDLVGRYGKEDPERGYEWYHIEWMKMGGRKQPAASLEELKRKHAWLLTLRPGQR